MTVRACIAAGAILLAGGTGSACHHNRTVAAGGVVATQIDSLVGIVFVTGTSFEQQLMLRKDSVVHQLTASSGDSAALVRLGGLEVLVRGQMDGALFRVATFEARSIFGTPVIDGVVIRDANGIALRTQRGPVSIGTPPTAFDSLANARVWVTGPANAAPHSWGLIVPP